MTNLLRILFWTAIAVTLFATLRTITTPVPGSDKTQHAVSFGTLMLLAALAYPRARLAGLAVTLSGLGAAIEWIQPRFGRSADIMDWVADTIGIAIMLVVIGLIRRVSARQARGA